MNPIIEVGRRINYHGDMCNPGGEGLIVAVKGTPGQKPAQRLANGIGLFIEHGDCYFDAILFDGRKLMHMHEHSIGRRLELMEKVHGPALVAKAQQLAAQKIENDRIEAVRKEVAFAENEAARKIEKAPMFYWNGIKDDKGAKLQKAWYSTGDKSGDITIYTRNYTRFSDLVRKCFAVKNDTDIQTDYFDSDRIRVIPAHPLYAKVKAAMEAQEEHRQKRAEKRGGVA